MSWLTMLASFFLFRILFAYPYVFIALIALYILRDRIPNPADLFRRKRKIAQLTRMVEVNPYDSTARRNLGMLLLDEGKPADAATHLAEAYKKELDSAEVNHLMGIALLQSGKPGEAVPYLEKVIAVEPRFRYGESHLYLAEAQLALGKREDALASLERFMGINSTSIEGKYFLAKTLHALGRKQEARTAADEGIRFHKGNPSFRRRRDWRWDVKLKAIRRAM